MESRKYFSIHLQAKGVDPCLNLFQTAIALHQQGNLSEAKQLYEKILLDNPSHFDALHLSGVIASQSQMLDKAEEFFAKAIQINPKQAAVHYNLGKFLWLI